MGVFLFQKKEEIMLKLNASYSKKVPAAGEYPSQSYHASIEVELPDGLSQDQLQPYLTNRHIPSLILDSFGAKTDVAARICAKKYDH